MDGTLLIELNPGVELAVCAQYVHVGLAVIALVRFVDLGRSQDNNASAILIPLELDLVSFEEVLLRDGGIEHGNVVDTHGSGETLFVDQLTGQKCLLLETDLAFWYEYSKCALGTGRNGKVGDTLSP